MLEITAVLVGMALIAWIVNSEWHNLTLRIKTDDNLMRLGIDKTSYTAVTAVLLILGAFLGVFILKNWAAAVLMVVLLYFYREKSIKFKEDEHKAAIDAQAETALQLIASLYETMGDMVAAFEKTAACVPSPMSDELRRVVAEYRAGRPLPEAMLDLAERSGSRDIDVFVRGVILSEKYGTNTSEVIQDVSNLIKDRITLRDELKNEVRGQKLTVNIFLALIPIVGTLIFVFSPDARHTMTATTLGQVIVCGLIGVMYAGWYLTQGQGAVDQL